MQCPVREAAVDADGQVIVGWMDDMGLQLISAQKKHEMETIRGEAGRRVAARFTQPLVKATPGSAAGKGEAAPILAKGHP